MTDQELIYTGIEIVLMIKFPELCDGMKSAYGSYYDSTSEHPGAYPIFEDVFWDFLVELLSTNANEHVLERAFSFCERMASSRDTEVVNLLWIAIPEALAYDANELRTAWKYMGPKTQVLAREIASGQGWQDKLSQD
jgi:hypothetical protein